MKETILVIGGARSGKSCFAQELAARLGEKVLFVATGIPMDEEMRQRIEKHQRLRPKNWKTLEVCRDVGKKVARNHEDYEVILVDSISFLLNNLMHESAIEEVRERMLEEINELINCMEEVDASFIIVSDEVGMGIIPATKVGRVYRDVLGEMNQILAQHVDQVYLVVSGIPVKIKHRLR